MVKVVYRENKMFLFIYDRELIEDGWLKPSKAKHCIKCSSDELDKLLFNSISINFFGEKAVKKGLEKGLVHPDGISEINGVPCAIFIRI